jgi:UDP-glucose 4-epimerase
MKREAVLVTGGAGYIGSHVARDLAENGYTPVVLDNLSTGNRDAVLKGEFIEGDLAQTELVRDLIQRYDIKSVIHFAAFIEVEESVREPVKYYRNNFINSTSLVECCIQQGVENFVFSSTAAVYGIPAKLPVQEKDPLLPINPYGHSKMFTETMLGSVAAAHANFNYIALRYFNVAGADSQARIGQNYRNPTHLITRTLKTAQGRFNELYIYGTDYDTPDHSAIRDYIHVDDLASAHLLALRYLRETRSSDIFNCGYGQGYSVLEVVETARKVTGIDFKTTLTERRPGDPPALVADAALIQEKLGWTPRYNDLTYIIKTAWQWEQELAKREGTDSRE